MIYCPYCGKKIVAINKWLDFDHVGRIIDRGSIIEYHCSKCVTEFKIKMEDFEFERVTISCKLNGSIYKVLLMFKENITMIYKEGMEYEEYQGMHRTFLEKITSFDYIINFTPFNIEHKLKTILVFS